MDELKWCNSKNRQYVVFPCGQEKMGGVVGVRGGGLIMFCNLCSSFLTGFRMEGRMERGMNRGPEQFPFPHLSKLFLISQLLTKVSFTVL